MTAAWVTIQELRDRTPGLSDTITPETLDLAILAASGVLEGLSPVRPELVATVVPRGCLCGGQLYTGPYIAWPDGSPFYWRAGADLIDGSDGSDGCTHELVLPDSPILRVDAVRVAGELQPADTYELAGPNRLRRLQGLSWATPGRIEVDYAYGGNLDELAKLAVSKLAAELAKSMTPNAGACALPERVQTVTRQGITFAMLDPQAFLREGKTGIYIVDLFLTAHAAPVQTPTTSVWSADSPSFDYVRAEPAP